MNRTDLDLLRNSSLTILFVQYPFNVVGAVVSILAFFASTIQTILILGWKELREKNQILVLMLSLSDAVRSVAYELIYIKRIILAVTGMDEVSDQMTCMFWLLPIYLTTWQCQMAILVLSMERLIAIIAPVWYDHHHPSFKIWLLIFSLSVVLVTSVTSQIGTDYKKYVPICDSVTSPTQEYSLFVYYSTQIIAMAILCINVISGAVVVKKWRNSYRRGENMRSFSRHVKLQALKSLTAVVCLFLLTIFAIPIYLLMVNLFEWTASQSRMYLGFVSILSTLRGALDLPIYLAFNRSYREAFAAIFLFSKQHHVQQLPAFQIVARRRQSVVVRDSGNGNGGTVLAL